MSTPEAEVDTEIPMKSFAEMDYHADSERLVDILCRKVSNPNPLFFRVLTAYYLCVVASMMRCSIRNKTSSGLIPVNCFALNLSTSGSGKGYSTLIMESRVLNQFKNRFLIETMPLALDEHLPKLAAIRAARNGTDETLEEQLLRKENKRTGPFLFSFDSGSAPAVKQMRHKLLLSDAGAACPKMDEIGATLIGQTEILTTFLELYDTGHTSNKLKVNTAENERYEEIPGQTPTNALLFGSPNALLDGGTTEEGLFRMLDMGYARRCFFGYSKAVNRYQGKSASTVFNELTDPADDAFMDQISDHLETMADFVNLNKVLIVNKDTSILLIQYKQFCEQRADEYPESQEIKKNEMSHRYSKALKLAGAYAFYDGSAELTQDHLYQAIKLAEETGQAFQTMLKRDQSFVKLAKHIADQREDLTQADLAELPYYKGPIQAKQEMITQAVAWGYKNNIIIKRRLEDGIEFFRGETLTVTDLKQMIVAYSNEVYGAKEYVNETCTYEQLWKLTQEPGYHWITHHLSADDPGHRIEENCKPGFNLIVLDIDEGVDIHTAKLLLRDYEYLIHTTKSHTDEEHCFRIILPINFRLALDDADFKQFMNHVYDWLPFPVDRATNQRARKWLTHPGLYEYNTNPEAVLLDALPFIPKTSKNETYKQQLTSQSSLDALERWFLNHITDGNRNVMLHRYAMMMVQAAFPAPEIQTRVLSLNAGLHDPLPVREILDTIMVTVAKEIVSRA